jgi:predicted RecB family nuclease
MLGLARRYAGAAGVPDERAVAGFCASSQWIDLLIDIRRQFVLPGSLRLKELAGEIGFSWRDPEPGGENSLAWYRAAVGADAGGPVEQRPAPDNPMAQRVLRYNEDDVQATLALRRWLTARLTGLPTVADLEGPDLEEFSGAAFAATRPAG